MLFAAKYADGDMVQKPNIFSESGIRARIMPEGTVDLEKLLRQEDSLYYYTSDPTLNGIGLTAGGIWEGGIRLTPTELAPYAGWQIVALIWYHYDGSSPVGEVKVYDNGTATLPGPVITTEPYSGSVTGWERVDLASPVPITGTGDLWCVVEVNHGAGFFPLGCDDGPAIDGKGDWIYFGGAWEELQNYGLDYNWGFIAMVAEGGGPGVTWDFETGWQDWTHTNGQAFPAGWSVEAYNYQSSWQCPSPGDSSFWVDSDASGGVIQDTAWSPVVVPPNNMAWLVYGYSFYSYSGNDWTSVGVRTFSGGAWNAPVELTRYTTDTYGTWDTLDVSAYAGDDSIRVFFYYDGDYDWWSAFDNVGLYAPTVHDVGTSDIAAPGNTIASNTTIAPVATYNNFGSSDETFDVYFQIDEVGVGNVYLETQNVTVVVGGDTTITWPNWTSGTSGTIYDMYAYTVLAGDADPSNDTIYQQTTVNDAYWEILDPPTYPIPGAGMSEATGHDGYYYVFGVRNGAIYLDTILVYDITNNQWLGGGKNPYGPGSYGTANYVNGKFYRVGGTASFPTPLARIDILDPPNSWAAGATPPVGFLDQITGVYKDSLLYVLGGGNWSMPPVTAVYFYDTYNDSWTAATPFQTPGCGAMAGGIIDSFAVLAFGYKTANNYDNNYCVGIIDESNPASITWGSWIPVPGGAQGCRRVPSGVDEFNGELWVIGGQIVGGQLDRTLSYDPYTDTWTNWNMPKPQSVCNVTPIPITLTTAGDLGVFVGGGYASGIPYLADHEVFHTGNYTGIGEQPGEQGATSSFGFAPNIANPTKGYAPITYSTTQSGKVSMCVYDATGRLVRTLVDRVLEPAGSKTVYWNGKDNARRDIPNGIYFLRLEAEGKVANHKLILVR
jgi:hypothetical protein